MFYVEGGTDLENLRALARRIGHRAADLWDERINAFYVQNNFPDPELESELERVEGGFGVTPKKHFFALRELVPGLRGLAILDNDGKGREDSDEGDLRIAYWSRYEGENYFVTPQVLDAFVEQQYAAVPLLGPTRADVSLVMDRLDSRAGLRESRA